MQLEKKVAIIGGGVSGLSLAHYLDQKGIDYVLFEREKRLGGNAYTAKTMHNGKEKYVDMAVNDFNPITYQRLHQFLQKTQSETGKVKVDTSFHTSKGLLFRESKLKQPELRIQIERFKLEAMEVFHKEKYCHYSIQQYLEEKGYSPFFLQQYLYPRIQGLFFYPTGGLKDLPARFVMNFFGIQAGFQYQAAPTSIRHNFKGGAGAWIKQLVRTIPEHNILKGESPSITKCGSQFVVKTSKAEVRADRIVFACHANVVYQSYSHLLSAAQKAILSTIKYTRIKVVAHGDTSYLPLQKEQVSAYNCYVKAPNEPYSNYTITYNCNEHQNLSDGGQNHTDDQDYFFVTVNPVREIQPSFILRDRNGIPLIKEFSRNICDFDLARAQQELPSLQGIQNLYFTGGYTNGIGLHENCLKQSEKIATLLGESLPANQTMSPLAATAEV